MGLGKTFRMAGLLFLLLSYAPVASALWSGPNEFVSGGWGTGDQNFGFNSGEIKDQFPQNILILSDGKIIIEDWVNNRLKIYSASGTYLNSISQLGLRLFGFDFDRIVSFAWDNTIKNERIGVFSLSQATWLWVDKSKVIDSEKAVVAVANNNIYIWDGKSSGYKYSPTGQLLQTYTNRPLELGTIKELKLAPGQYKVTVKYPDKEWVTIGKGACPQYVRDTNGNLYCVGDIGVIRYDDKGNEIASLMMPKKKIEEIPAKDPGVEPMIKVIEEYGSPVVAPNGDVYTWKRTPDKYYIIKWTWQ